MLTHIARGRSNSEIAAEMYLSEATFRPAVSRILAKLDLRDRVQAVVLAYEEGLVQPGASRRVSRALAVPVGAPVSGRPIVTNLFVATTRRSSGCRDCAQTSRSRAASRFWLSIDPPWRDPFGHSAASALV